MAETDDNPVVHQRKQKKTLLSFLKFHLENETIYGLSWIDKGKETWQLPWKIHRPTIWGEPDAKVLHAWAIYKYNYKNEVPSRQELSKWKENLRNSIHTCPSIKEIEHFHEQKVPQPFKVYQFIGRETKGQTKFEAKGTVSSGHHCVISHISQNEEMLDDEVSRLPNFSVLTQSHDLPQFSPSNGNPSPCSWTSTDNSLDTNLNSDFDNIDIEDLLKVNCKVHTSLQNQEQTFDMQLNDLHVDDKLQITCTPSSAKTFQFVQERDISGIQSGNFRSRSPLGRLEDNLYHDLFKYAHEDTDSLSNATKSFRDAILEFSRNSPSITIDEASVKTTNEVSNALPLSITVSYISNQVMHELLMYEKFKLCYVDNDLMRDSILQCPTPDQFGPSDAFLVELPHLNNVTCFKQEHSQIISTVLNHMKRGITVTYSQGDIYVKRFCKAVAYYRAKSGEQIKLERDENVKVFDFQGFKSQFHQAQMSSLTSDVRINFGVKSSSVEVVTVTITHLEAQKMLQAKHNHELQVFTEVDCSLSNEFDKRLSLEQKLKGAHC